MKTNFFAFTLLLSLLLMTGCSSSPITTKATGFAYEVVVTMDKVSWDGEAGRAVKAELQSDIPGLNQSEPAFKITYASPDNFNGLLTYVRNILIVKIDKSMYTKVSLSYENDTWASGQVVLVMSAPNPESLTEYLENNKGKLVAFFTKIEMNRAVEILKKNYSGMVMDHLKKQFDISLNAPADMTYMGKESDQDFFWASNNANTGRTDLLVYTFPYTDPNTFTLEYLVAKRDSILKENLPGAFPDSYMATETYFAQPTYTAINVNGKYCGVLRGLWKMVNDKMGGPFVAHVRLDEKNNRVVVAEGFVFAPETTKRNFIRRVEASLYTLRLPGDEDTSKEDTSLGVDEKK